MDELSVEQLGLSCRRKTLHRRLLDIVVGAVVPILDQESDLDFEIYRSDSGEGWAYSETSDRELGSCLHQSRRYFCWIDMQALLGWKYMFQAFLANYSIFLWLLVFQAFLATLCIVLQLPVFQFLYFSSRGIVLEALLMHYFFFVHYVLLPKLFPIQGSVANVQQWWDVQCLAERSSRTWVAWLKAWERTEYSRWSAEGRKNWWNLDLWWIWKSGEQWWMDGEWDWKHPSGYKYTLESCDQRITLFSLSTKLFVWRTTLLEIKTQFVYWLIPTKQ